MKLSLPICQLFLVALALANTASAATRPNVLFIAVDDLNDWIGVLEGNPQVKTPNYDRLARRGTLFTRAYCAAPSCNPSRVAVLTGIRPSTSGVYVNEQPFRTLLPETVTLPQYFTSHGYQVAGGGKVFHGNDTNPPCWAEYFKRPKDPPARDPRPKSLSSMPAEWSWGPTAGGDEAMSDYQVVSWASGWLAQPHEKPFFLAVGLSRPHMPLHVPQKYFDAHPLDGIELPLVKQHDLDDVPPLGRWLPEHRQYHQKIVAAGQWQHVVQAYLAAIEFSDAMLGHLLDALDRNPQKDNTVVVLWSDHGWHLGQKDHWSKFALWEQATRSPLMVVAPGVTKPEQRSAAPVSLLDLYPTLVELCDLPRPAQLEGQSLVPQLRDANATRIEPAVMTFGPNNHAVRDPKWRYIRYADGAEELYDEALDPREWTNLAADPTHSAVKQRLAQWLPKVNKPLSSPTKWLP